VLVLVLLPWALGPAGPGLELLVPLLCLLPLQFKPVVFFLLADSFPQLLAAAGPLADAAVAVAAVAAATSASGCSSSVTRTCSYSTPSCAAQTCWSVSSAVK
jgi:hypothetical protein